MLDHFVGVLSLRGRLGIVFQFDDSLVTSLVLIDSLCDTQLEVLCVRFKIAEIVFVFKRWTVGKSTRRIGNGILKLILLIIVFIPRAILDFLYIPQRRTAPTLRLLRLYHILKRLLKITLLLQISFQIELFVLAAIIVPQILQRRLVVSNCIFQFRGLYHTLDHNRAAHDPLIRLGRASLTSILYQYHLISRGIFILYLYHADVEIWIHTVLKGPLVGSDATQLSRIRLRPSFQSITTVSLRRTILSIISVTVVVEAAPAPQGFFLDLLRIHTILIPGVPPPKIRVTVLYHEMLKLTEFPLDIFLIASEFLLLGFFTLNFALFLIIISRNIFFLGTLNLVEVIRKSNCLPRI